MQTGVVFNIQGFSIHDGPGIRTTVFLKGCPLRCSWCANPESINHKPELAVSRSRCNNCGKCLEICPEGAIAFSSDKVIEIDRGRCTACGRCVEVCYPEALNIYGKERTVEDVFEKVQRDRIFYQGSGGGVTVSGGEPLAQPEFVTALFEACHQAGIQTCLDTCGYASPEVLKKVLALTDHVLYDIKHMDSKVYRRFTGKPNDLILANAKAVAMSGVSVLFRMPLIPTVNDSLQNIRVAAHFLKTLRDDITIEVLPYHRMGMGKYKALDKSYPAEGIKPSESGHIEWVRKTFEELGVHCI